MGLTVCRSTAHRHALHPKIFVHSLRMVIFFSRDLLNRKSIFFHTIFNPNKRERLRCAKRKLKPTLNDAKAVRANRK